MSAEPRSWSEEACPKCKGYPGYETCECSPEVLARRDERRSAANRPYEYDPIEEALAAFENSSDYDVKELVADARAEHKRLLEEIESWKNDPTR